MNKIRQLLLVSPISQLHGANHYLPVHLVRLACHLREHAGLDVHVADLIMDIGFPRSDKGFGLLVDRFLDDLYSRYGGKTDGLLVGFSLTSYMDLVAALPLAKAVKRHVGATVVVGGYAATLHAQSLTRYAFLDHIVLGPGEEALAELAGAAQATPLPRVIDGRQLTERARKDRLPLDLDVLSHPRSYRRVLYFTGSGCPFKCRFCFESAMHGQVRSLPMSQIAGDFAEMRSKLSESVKVIRISDPIWGQSSERVSSVLSAADDSGFKVSFDTRCDVLNKIEVERFRDRVAYVTLGLESASARTLRAMGKTAQPVQYLASAVQSVSNLWSVGVVPRLNVITNFPGSTRQDQLATVDFAESLRELHDRQRCSVGFIVSINWFARFGGERIDSSVLRSCSWRRLYPLVFSGIRMPRNLASLCVTSSRGGHFADSARIAARLSQTAAFSRTVANGVFHCHMIAPNPIRHDGAQAGKLADLVGVRRLVARWRPSSNAGSARTKLVRLWCPIPEGRRAIAMIHRGESIDVNSLRTPLSGRATDVTVGGRT